MKRNQEISHDAFNDTRKLNQESIYPTSSDETYKSISKRFVFVHWGLKYKLFSPGIWLINSLVCKKLIEDVPNKWYWRNIKIFNDSWIETQTIMSKVYAKGINHHAEYTLLRKIILTLVMYDTALQEACNVFCHTLAKNMHKQYAPKQGTNKQYHVLYTAKHSYNPIFFNLAKLAMVDKIPLSKLRNERVKNRMGMYALENEELKKDIQNLQAMLHKKQPQMLIQLEFPTLKDKLKGIKSIMWGKLEVKIG